MWVASTTGPFIGANIFPCFGNKDRRFEDRNLELFARGIFILYTNIISKFKRDFFATRSLESYNTRNTRTLISSIVPDCVTQRCDDIDYKCTRLRIVNIGRSTINTIV